MPQIYFHDKILAKTILPLIPRSVQPNYLTVFRFVTAPVVIFLLWQGYYLGGLIAFTLVAFTDMLDGSLARTRNQITDWGKIYDPLADKFLICGTLGIMFLKLAYSNFYLVLTVIFLEIFTGYGALLMKNKKGKDIQANWWGKIKMLLETAGIFIALISLVAGAQFLMFFATGAFGLAILFGLVSILTQSA